MTSCSVRKVEDRPADLFRFIATPSLSDTEEFAKLLGLVQQSSRRSTEGMPEMLIEV